MAIITLNNNSLSSVTALPASVPVGSWTKIGDTVTCSDTANVDFDNLSSDYQMYVVIGSQIRPSVNSESLRVNFGTDGSTYSAIKTSTYYYQYNNESDNDLLTGTSSGNSLGFSTLDQVINSSLSNHGNYGKAGMFIGYFSGIGQGSAYASYDIFSNVWQSGNYNTSTRVCGSVQGSADCMRFKFGSGNIATGKITLYGVNQ